jgi:hypothetical protein
MWRSVSGCLVPEGSRQRKLYHYVGTKESGYKYSVAQRRMQEELTRHSRRFENLNIRKDRRSVTAVFSVFRRRGSSSRAVHLSHRKWYCITYRTVATHNGRSTAAGAVLVRLLLPGQRCCWATPASSANLPLPYSQGLRTRHTPQYALDLILYSLLTSHCFPAVV